MLNNSNLILGQYCKLYLIKEKTMQFHSHLNTESFKDLQLQNRKLWEEVLTLGGFFKKICK